ncbi:chemotaxis protein CheB [Rhizobium sp. Root482]|uniref:chemotaxis protein CheB n=1 Tax=Rhizobium sp. Root482 TaxID=1736543 RepID=UPI000AFCB98B|nr:chemotaxis protein CheB [Rhizobium sp. Root482]
MTKDDHRFSPFPIVGVGWSSEGFAAVRKFLNAVDALSGMAYVFIRHIDPSDPYLTAKRLADHAPIPVIEARNGMAIKADHAYLGTSGTYVAVEGLTLRVTDFQLSAGSLLPIDFLFHSLAVNFKDRAIAVVLSGIGSDGSLGVRTVNEAGGLVLAEDPRDAEPGGMPRSAIDTGAVTAISGAENIPDILRTFALGRNLPIYPFAQEMPWDSIRIRPPATDAHETAIDQQKRVFKEGASTDHELCVPDGQLPQAMERRPTTPIDPEKAFYSADAPALLLDGQLNICLFTPASRSLFNILPTDIGKPIADLGFRLLYPEVLEDIGSVLADGVAREREINVREGRWFVCRAMHCRHIKADADGVVVLFEESKKRGLTAHMLQAATRDAEDADADAPKSRFLAAASHDLRQPLQALKLIHGLLDSRPDEELSERLTSKLGETISLMAAMLNAMLDISQIEAGAIQPRRGVFPVSKVLDRLKGEFSPTGPDRVFRVLFLPSSLMVSTDERLFEQILRNLISNVLKYSTGSGKIIVGCRASGPDVIVQVRDSDIDLKEGSPNVIFDEFPQATNDRHERFDGIGVGLSIVGRLADLLGHTLTAKSKMGKGSVFSIRIPQAPKSQVIARPLRNSHLAALPASPARASILLFEDDTEIRRLLRIALMREGHRVVSMSNANETVRSIASWQAELPDIIIASLDLPDSQHGLRAISEIRRLFAKDIPAIVLTADISSATLQTIAERNFHHLFKPFGFDDLTKAICNLVPLRTPAERGSLSDADLPPILYIVDDDPDIRAIVRLTFEKDGWRVRAFATCEAFLAAYDGDGHGCLLVDAYLPAMSGLDLLNSMDDAVLNVPVIIVGRASDVATSVSALRAGAFDFIEKPVAGHRLLASALEAMRRFHKAKRGAPNRGQAKRILAKLTARQRQVMELVVLGHTNKAIALKLGISQRTVENHRASLLKKTGSPSLAALAQLVGNLAS